MRKGRFGQEIDTSNPSLGKPRLGALTIVIRFAHGPSNFARL